MIKIGVLGAGHLGKIHIHLLQESKFFDLVGFYDSDQDTVAEIAEKYNLKAFSSIDELIANVTAVDVVTPTLSHFDCAAQAIRNSKHVFIEKPISNTIEEAKKLIDLSTEADVKVQIGHVERYNPAFLAAHHHITHPMFIETHRLAQFNPRGTDVPVVLDLMIHDIDIILSVVKSNIKRISASGVAVVSDSPDIANARIEFDNGCVANLTASRISMKNMRKSRFFQKDAYISVDFLDKSVEVIKLKNVTGTPDPLAMTLDLGNGKGVKEIYFDNPKVEPNNAILSELNDFAKAINEDFQPYVSIHDGYNALDVANKIVEKLKINGSLVL